MLARTLFIAIFSLNPTLAVICELLVVFNLCPKTPIFFLYNRALCVKFFYMPCLLVQVASCFYNLVFSFFLFFFSIILGK